MSVTRILAISVVKLCLFSSCEREIITVENDELLRKVVSDCGDSILYTFFQYDTSKRLEAIKDSNNNGDVSNTSIKYNAQGKPISFKTIYYSLYRNSTGSSVDSLVYENLKVIKKLYRLSSSTFYQKTNTYTYDAKGRLICDSSYYGYPPFELYGYDKFFYNDNNDVIQVKR